MRSRLHVITALLIATSACGPRTRRTPDDTLVLVIESAMTTSDPRFAISNYDSKLTRLVGAGLTAVDTDSLLPRLDLAAKMEPLEVEIALPINVPLVVGLPGKPLVLPGLVVIETLAPAWDITLREARFSDGARVTAEDVAFTFSSVLDPKTTSLHHKAFAERFWSVRALSPEVVRITLKQPLATLKSDLDFAIVSKRTGRGAGPYLLRELTSTYAMLDANPYYYGDAPKTPHVQFKFVRDAAARLLMLVGGTADLIQNSGVRMDLVDEVRERPRVHIDSGPSVLLTYLMLNNDDPLLRDRRVRQAIALAIDRTSLITSRFKGRARLANGLLPEHHWAYSGDVPHFMRDVARAKQLLDEAGLRDPDGDGPRPRASFVYKTSSDAFRMMVARTIASQLAEVGLDVEVRAFEFATFFADIKKGSYQIASMQTAELNEPDYYFFYFHSSRIPDARNPDGGNRWRYRSAALDAAAVAGRKELEPETRKRIYAEAQRIIATDLPIIPLWHEDNVVLTNVDVKGYVLTTNARFIGLIKASKR